MERRMVTPPRAFTNWQLLFGLRHCILPGEQTCTRNKLTNPIRLYLLCNFPSMPCSTVHMRLSQGVSTLEALAKQYNGRRRLTWLQIASSLIIFVSRIKNRPPEWALGLFHHRLDLQNNRYVRTKMTMTMRTWTSKLNWSQFMTWCRK